ncbi:MAG: ribonuclease Z [Thermoleophilia bacterium]|nr:ribonuclease Z [Thermoleophilia bacterium]
MDLHLVFLGTAGATPTVDRGSPAILIARGSERILVDCGEGTQRQLMRSVGLARINLILVTHLHGDHYLGLPGLLKTYSLLGREEPLLLLGPPGTYELLKDAERLVGRPRFPFVVEEIEPGAVIDRGDYQLRTAATDHGVPGLAWALEEKPRPGRFHPERAIALGVTPGPDFGRLQRGETITAANGRVIRPEEVMDAAREGRKVVISGDTRPAASVIELARSATVLVHDSTFGSSELERALETKHSTAREAALVAAAAGVKTLILTHISSRHSWRELRDEAREVFPDSYLPKDFDTLVVPYPEKGPARLERV